MKKFNLTIYTESGRVIWAYDNPVEMSELLSDMVILTKPSMFGSNGYKFVIEREDIDELTNF